MPTITFDAPEELAQKVSTLPKSKRDAWLAEVLEHALNEETLSDTEIAFAVPAYQHLVSTTKSGRRARRSSANVANLLHTSRRRQR